MVELVEIPHKIHLIYASQNIPARYEKYYNSILEQHPDWDIVIYDDEQAREIIKTARPELLAVYDGYLLPVQRTDFFRVMIVYLQGGFYLDLDMYCYKSVEPLCKYQLVLGEEKTLSEEECIELKTPYPLRIANYMFGGVPYHPFFSELIDELVYRSGRTVLTENDVLDTTGPGLLTEVFHMNKSQFADITLLTNSSLLCPKYCQSISCHFGDYAGHYHLGSWRWA